VRLALSLAGVAALVASAGCSLILDFGRFADGGAADGGGDGGTGALTLRCGDDGAGCILDEGIGTGARGLPAELRASGAIFGASVSVAPDPSGTTAPLLVEAILPPSGQSDVVGLVLLAPIAETIAAGSETVDLIVTVGGTELPERVTVTVQYHAELIVGADTDVTGDGMVHTFSNVLVMAGALRASGAEPYLLHAFGDVHLDPSTALDADAIAGDPMLMMTGAGPGAGGAGGGAGGIVGIDGITGGGLGGGAGGQGGSTPTAGGGAGHGVGGTPAGTGGAVYGDGTLDPFTALDSGGSGGGGGGGGSTGVGGVGGHGGGALRIETEGSVLLDAGARISADGSSGTVGAGNGAAGGGGSGGAVWIASAEGITGPPGSVRAFGGAGPGGSGGSGYVRLDAPGAIDPTLATPVPLFYGLRWDAALAELAAIPDVDATLWGDPNSAVTIEVDDLRGNLATTTGLVIGAARSLAVSVTLNPGWNRLRACTPDCLAPVSSDDITIIYVP